MFSFSLLMVTIAYTGIGYIHTEPVFDVEHPVDTDPPTPQALVQALQPHVVVVV
jgi:hypothetical protein